MSASESEEKRRAARRQRASVVFVALGSALTMGAMVALAVKMVVAGRGLETHLSFWLVQDTWLGFLVTMAVCVVAVLGGVAWHAVQRRREARLWQKHEARWAEGRKPEP